MHRINYFSLVGGSQGLPIRWVVLYVDLKGELKTYEWNGSIWTFYYVDCSVLEFVLYIFIAPLYNINSTFCLSLQRSCNMSTTYEDSTFCSTDLLYFEAFCPLSETLSFLLVFNEDLLFFLPSNNLKETIFFHLSDSLTISRLYWPGHPSYF